MKIFPIAIIINAKSGAIIRNATNRGAQGRGIIIIIATNRGYMMVLSAARLRRATHVPPAAAHGVEAEASTRVVLLARVV